MELTNTFQKIGEVTIGNAGYGNITLRLYGRYTEQSQENNTTTVQYQIRHYLPSSYANIKYYSSSQKFLEELTNSSTNATNLTFYPGETTLLTQTKPIEHEKDGSKSISVGASFTNSYFTGNPTVKIEPVSVDLPKIDRLNTIILNNGEYFHVDIGEYEPNEIPVELKKYVDEYTTNLKLYYETSSDEGTPRYELGERINFNGSTLSFTEEELTSIYSAIPYTRFIRIICIVETYDAETKLGETEYISVGALSSTDLYPIFNDFEYEDINKKTTDLTGNPQILVKGYSDVQMVVSETNKAIGRKGATISKYTFANGTPIQDITTINYPIKTEKFKPQNKELGVTAIDSRELPASVVKDLANIAGIKNEIIEWNNDMPGEQLGQTYIRASDKVFTKEELLGQPVELTNGDGTIETTIITDFADVDSYYGCLTDLSSDMPLVMIVKETTEDAPFPTGTYFFHYFGTYTSKLTASVEGNVNCWIEYTKLEKMPFSAERKNAGTSTQVTLKLSGNIWNGNFGKEDNKIISAIYKYKKTTDGEDKWVKGTTTLNVVKNGSSYSLTQDIAGDLGATGFDQEESYNIYVEVSDQLSTVSDTFTLGAGSPGIARYKNCVALGAPYDEQLGGRVQITEITGDTNVKGKISSNGKEVALKEEVEKIESGSNENGSWLKFPDGTMIVRQSYTVNFSGSWTAWGSGYTKPVALKEFPIEFKEIPTVNFWHETTAYLFSIMPCNTSGYVTATTTKRPTDLTLFRSTSMSAETYFIVHIIAIGKWK